MTSESTNEYAPVHLSDLKAGMELCTFDFQRWGTVRLIHDEEGQEHLVGNVDETGLAVYVPASAIVETHGQCIRLIHPRAEIDGAGWDQQPAGVPD